MRFRLLGFKTLLALTIVAACTSVAADDASIQVVNTGSAPAPIEAEKIQPAPTSMSPLQEISVQVISAARAGQLSKVAELGTQLRERASEQGYENLPFLSLALLSQANIDAENGKRESVIYLVRQALEFSPSDSHILLSVASYYPFIGMGEATKVLFRAILKTFSAPSQLASFLVTALFLALCAGTLILILAAVLQHALYATQIITALSFWMPLHKRGIGGVALYTTLLVVPLFFGLIPALIVWCVLLSKYRAACRRMCLAVGIVVVCWGLSLPIYATLQRNMTAPLQSTLESVNANSFAPGTIPFLTMVVDRQADDSIARFALASELLHSGDFKSAEPHWKKLVVSEERRIEGPALVNYGVALAGLDRFEEARTALLQAEKKGIKSFALYYHLAKSSMALTDVANHDLYYSKARAIDPVRADIERVVSGDLKGAAIFTNPLPMRTVGWRLMAPYAKVNRYLATGNGETVPALATNVEASVNGVLSSLIPGTSANFAAILGFVVACIGMMLLKHGKQAKDYSVFREKGHGSIALSRYWSMVPGGRALVGERPLTGVAAISVCVMFFLASIGTPIPIHTLSVRPEGAQSFFFLLAMAATLLGCSVSWIGRKR